MNPPRHRSACVRRGLGGALALLLGACLLVSEAGATEAGRSPLPPDSAEVLRDVQRTMEAYLREMRRTSQRQRGWNLPADREASQEERARVLEALDQAAAALPGDDWIVGHRVGMRVKAERVGEALEVAEACEGSAWWCRALEGFVHHVEGDSLAAHLAFDEAIETMDPEERCEWQKELGEVLVGALRRPYNRASCEELDELARRVWWLADPFHLLPWNDWRSEHLARVVGMRLHHQSLDLIAARCDPEHHMYVLVHGWPEWWWGYDHGWERPRPPGHQFLPPSSAALRPFESQPWDWDLIEDPYLERVDLGYELIHDLDQQTAFFVRGDSILVAASVEMDRHILRGEASLTTGIVLSAGAGSERFSVRREGPPEHFQFRLTAPRDSYLVSVESIAETWGAARTRFGHRLPEPSPSGLALSDLLFFEWDEGLDDELDTLLPRMLGTQRIASDREVGIFWETYGWEEGEALELSIRVLGTEEGFFRRIGRALRIVGESEAVRLTWSEAPREPDAEGPAGRSLRLDLAHLEPGRYLIELQARAGAGDEPAVTRRHVEVDWR